MPDFNPSRRQLVPQLAACISLALASSLGV